MRVTIQLFALAKVRAGRSEVDLELPEPARVADLKRALGRACPRLEPLLPNLRIAVESEYADDDRPIAPGAELAAILPVSGGARPASLSWGSPP